MQREAGSGGRTMETNEQIEANIITQAELDFAVAQTVRVRAELTSAFAERAIQVFALETIFNFGQLFAEYDKDELATILNAVLEKRATGFRLLRVN
jgi:hypothetical protein